jgi:hypothetical protein
MAPEAAAVELSERSRQAVARNLMSAPEIRVDQGGSIAESYKRTANNVINAKSVADLDIITKSLNDQINKAALTRETSLIHHLSAQKDRVMAMRERSIMREGIKNARSVGEGEEAAKAFINEWKENGKGYAGVLQPSARVAEMFGWKRGKITPQQFVDFLDEIAPEDVVRKLFDGNDINGLRELSKLMPNEFEMIRKLKLSEIQQKSLFKGELSVQKLSTLTKKMAPEILETLFGREGMTKLKSLHTLQDAMPEILNKSGTSIRNEYVNLFNPANIIGGLQTRVIYEAQPLLQQMKSSETMQINSSIRKILTKGSEAAKKAVQPLGQAIRLSGIKSIAEMRREYKSLQQDVTNNLEDQNFLMDRLEVNTRGVNNMDTMLAGALQMKTLKATQFLQSKMPKQMNSLNMFTEKKYEPSDMELSKFNRYVRTVNNPMTVLSELEAGTLTKESMEAMTEVYPELLSKMKSSLLAIATESPKEFSYQERVALSMFMGVSADQTATPGFTAAMQANFAPKQQQQNESSQPMGDMSKLDISSRHKTKVQNIESR